jgi:hypothetical protein
LTRVSMHYAFLTGMKFLGPKTAGPNKLPPHLVRPVIAPGPTGDGEPRFDLARATAHLLDEGHDAGVLACIAHPEVRAALDSRSRPVQPRRPADTSRPSYRAGPDSPYLSWLKGEEQIARLRRKLRLDLMPRRAESFTTARSSMRQDWGNWRWQI